MALTFRMTCGSMTRIDGGVFVGGFLAAADRDQLRARGVTHVLKLGADPPEDQGGPLRHPGLAYMVVPAEDRPDYPLDRHFADCLDFIRQALRGGGRVLIHGRAGVSRSATIAVLHLMVNSGLSLSEALARARAARPVISPNRGFLRMLAAVDRRLARRRLTGVATLRLREPALPGPGA